MPWLLPNTCHHHAAAGRAHHDQCQAVLLDLQLTGSCRRIKLQDLLLTLQHTNATESETTWEALGLQDCMDMHRQVMSVALPFPTDAFTSL